MQDFVDVLSFHAKVRPEKTAFIMLDIFGAETDRLTYAALDYDARSIGTFLRTFLRPERRVLILHSAGLDFIRAFMGCQYAGVVAVPLSLLSRHNTYRSRIEYMIKDARISVIIADDTWACTIRDWLTESSNSWLPVVTVEECRRGAADSWCRPRLDTDSVSVIQYTSGSTGEPKGVMIRSKNLIQNSCLVRDSFGYDENLVAGGWLPLFHNMGLTALVLQPIFLGATAVMMAPASFIKRPASWLKAISTYRIQASGGPNFCFEHCLSHINARNLSDVDLTCWRLCFSGGEPVRQDIIKRFFGRFRRYGLQESAFCPCYGMAETTLFVASCRPHGHYRTIDVDGDKLENRQIVLASPTTSRRQTLVGCEVTSAFDVAIVHPATRRRIGPRHVGEIWLRGGSIAAGYWGKPELSHEIFGAVLQGEIERPWLRTGDLGFIERNELFICGRLKDMIIVGGRCLDPDDIERRVPALSPLLKGSSVVAFGTSTDNTQSVTIVCGVPVKAYNAATCKALVRLIRGTIATEIGVPVSRVVFAARGSIPHSTNGRPLRQETQHRLNSGQLDTIWNDQLQMSAASPEIIAPNFHALLISRILRSSTGRIAV